MILKYRSQKRDDIKRSTVEKGLAIRSISEYLEGYFSFFVWVRRLMLTITTRSISESENIINHRQKHFSFSESEC